MNQSDEHPSKRKVLPPDERREMILEAALEVFSRGGFQDAEVDDIAQVAGIGKGTIYRYYSSKTDLYRAVLERVFVGLFEQVQAIGSESSSLEETILRGLSAHVAFFTENPRCWRVLMVGRKEDPLPDVCDTILAHKALHESVRAMIDGGIADGYFREVDPQFASYALMALGVTIVEKHFHQNKDTRQEDIKSAADIFLRGIKK
jgi:AcrR family transcriptional regulator